MAQNDYQTFGDSGTDGVNKLSLANYTSDNDRVYGNGYTTKVIRSQLHNKALQQTSKISAAVAQFLVNNGQDALDTDSFSTLATKLGSVYNKFGGSITAATTLTAAQSGGRFTVAAATVAYNITLPTASAGLNFEFEGVNGAYAVGLTYAGTLYLPDGTTVAAGTFSQINLGAIGNTIKVWSDGGSWFMSTLGQEIVKNGVSNNQAVTLGQLNLKAPLDSPALTGTPTAPTAAAGTNTTQLATTANVYASVNRFGGAITAATTLTAAQSGAKFYVQASTAAYNITLPTASAGLNFEFEGVNGAYAVGLTYAGTLYLPDGTTVAAGTFSQINLGAIGNTIKVWSDGGGSWFMSTLGQEIVKPALANNQAVNFSQVIGLGQTWQNVTASRALATTYTNTTGKPIVVTGTLATNSTTTPTLYAIINGVTVYSSTKPTSSGGYGEISFIVPSGSTYSISTSSGPTLYTWFELR